MSAQATLGNPAVSGTVRDESGAAIPAAKVRLVETSRGLTRDAIANETGGFLFPTASAGIYSLTVSKVAFETYRMSDVRVEIGDRATLDVVLKVGQVSSVFSVSAGERMLLETEWNALGTVIDSERVESLPLNGRSFLQRALSAGGANTPVGNSNAVQAQTGHPDRAVILTGNMPQTTGLLHNLRTDGLIAFDTSCFEIPPVGFFGSAGGDILNAPGANTRDIGFQKFFTVAGEQKKLEFRAELFNAFNHANFGLPNANVADGLNFGRVSSAAAPRLIQPGMKFLF